MRFGLFQMPEHYPWDNMHVSWKRDMDDIVFVENLGFHEAWIGEHHTGYYENVPAPDIMIATVATMTKRILLGTGTMNLPYHSDPFLLAERMAFLDNIIEGRLIYGFGGGALPDDQKLFNLTREEIRPRINESIEVIRQLLTTREPVTWNGKFSKGENRKLMIGPYMGKAHFGMAGLTSLVTYDYCGKHGWDALSVHVVPPTYKNNKVVPSLRDQGMAMENAAKAAGRDPLEARRNWKVVREVYVHPEGRKAALDEIRAGVNNSYFGYTTKLFGALMKQDSNEPEENIDLEYMADNVQWIVGNPQECVDAIHKVYEAVGGFGTLMINNRDWVQRDKKLRSLEMFARYVMPRVEGLEVGEREQRYLGRDFPAPLPLEHGGRGEQQ